MFPLSKNTMYTFKEGNTFSGLEILLTSSTKTIACSLQREPSGASVVTTSDP